MKQMWRASACGNTFLVLRDGEYAPTYLENLRQRGSWNFDTALLLSEGPALSIRMRVLERDGSESVMCGNGARAVAEILKREGRQPVIAVQRGLISIERQGNGEFAVPMGLPVFAGLVPLRLGRKVLLAPRYEVCGEPHVVVLADNLRRFPIVRAGIQVVPQANLTVLSVLKRGQLVARTFERGINRVTASCGTGACAAAYYARQHVWHGNKEISVYMGGHRLAVRLGDGTFWLQGPTEIKKERR